MHISSCTAVIIVLIIAPAATSPTKSFTVKTWKKMSLHDALIKEKVVPEVIDKEPATVLKVFYPSGANVDLGNVLAPTLVKDLPMFDYDAKPESLYTIVMVDPDAPSRADPKLREILHFMQSNIPGKDTSKGDILVEYIGSGPPKGTGLHRYIFLLFEQKNGVLKSNMKTPKTSREGRMNFSIKKFAQENNLGDPIAANFYQAEFDDYVPLLHKQLSG